MNLKNATVTLIGGSGFVGRSIVQRLAQAGAHIKILTRNPDKAKPLKPLGAIGQISIIGGDALNDTALANITHASDAVINTVGILAERGRQRFATLQAELPQRIAIHAIHAERIIHISAIGADANSPVRYAASKGVGEAGLHQVFPDATILRPSLIFGEGDGFFNRFAQMAVLAPGLPVIGGGRNRVQPVFVGDVAAAVLACLKNDATKGQIYELGGPDILTFKEVMAYILRVTGRRRLLLPIPHFAMMLAAIPLGVLPNPPVTRDQLRQLCFDNVVSHDALGLADLGIAVTPIDLIVPNYLARYRVG